ncbi:CoA-binding protein [Desulfonatronum parangueonense]
MLNLAELAPRLAQVKTIAVLGAKDVSGRPVDRVGRYLIGRGFKVFPVHPVRRDVWGLPTYSRLSDIPDPIDLVDVFRAPQFCAEHAREVLELDPLPAIFWMQSGISNAEARNMLQAAGVFVVENLCLMIEHQQL